MPRLFFGLGAEGESVFHNFSRDSSVLILSHTCPFFCNYSVFLAHLPLPSPPRSLSLSVCVCV